MSIQKLAGFVLPVLKEPESCEACGNSFICGATLAGCWCTEVRLSEQARAHLRARYERCLCRPCLERFAAADQEQRSGEPAAR